MKRLSFSRAGFARARRARFAGLILVLASCLLLVARDLASQQVTFSTITLDTPNPQAFAFFGIAVAAAGDVNGDGVGDLLVGAHLQDVGGNTDQGQAFVFSGADGSLLATLDDPNPQAGAVFGVALAGVRDVSGDEVPDLLVGASEQDVGGNLSQGQAFVFSGADASLLLTLDDPNPQAQALFGGFGTVAGVGDVNGDGVPDLLVGAFAQDVGANINQGQAFLFSGADASLLRTLAIPNPQVGSFFGETLVGVGDVNSDGVGDLLVGAFGQDVGGNINQGQAFVFSGADGSLLATLDDPNPQPFAAFGQGVAGVGDVNGDGVGDLLVGARFQDVGGNTDQGQAFLFSGQDGSLLRTLDNPNLQAGARFGLGVAGLGDVNGDGVPDLLVGAPGQDVGGNTDQGQAFLFSGQDGSPLRTLDNPNPQAGARFGLGVAGLGDVNGDGAGDLLVGAFGQDVGGNTDQGQAFLFLSRSLTPAEAIEQLKQDVLDLNLLQGIENSLDFKLDAVLRALDDLNQNNNAAVINSLQAFINAVEAQRGVHISEADADKLVADAQAIITLLGG